MFVSENNQVFDAKFKLGISADVVNSKLDANLVGFSGFRKIVEYTPAAEAIFYLKSYFFD